MSSHRLEWRCGMQGNCTSDVPGELRRSIPGASLLPLQPRQCVVLADQPFLAVSNPLWISRMVLRMRDAGRGSAVTFVRVNPGPESKLWVSDSALQGEGGSVNTAVMVEGQAHIMGARHRCLPLLAARPPPVVTADSQHLSHHTQQLFPDHPVFSICGVSTGPLPGMHMPCGVWSVPLEPGGI